MKLLVTTQKVDRADPILGFFHAWIIELAKHFDVVTIICLEEGEHELPANVRVLTLGKSNQKLVPVEAQVKRRIGYVWKFYTYILKEHKNYDAVFVHMNPVYSVLGWPIWRSLGKKVSLWYVHRSVDLKLRAAAILVDRIFTASKESFKISSKKVLVVGHGIETGRFAGITRPLPLPEDPIRVLHVGRITKIKNCDVLIEAAGILSQSWSRRVEVIFVGEMVTPADHEYRKKLDDQIKNLGLTDMVRFVGPIPNHDIGTWYAQADLTVNLAPTGGVDKAVLESLASGAPVFWSNESFSDIFHPYESIFHIAYKDAGMLAEKIRLYCGRMDASSIEAELRARVVERFSIDALISRISLDIHDSSR
ncbi:MAG: glycosyltransferase family 4 protein [Patescibacteria group bacterium]